MNSYARDAVGKSATSSRPSPVAASKAAGAFVPAAVVSDGSDAGGTGGGNHLASTYFMDLAGIKMTHIPYKGSAPAMIDLLGGRLDLIFDYSIVVKPQIEAGKLRPLASTGAVRLTSHPDVPTATELGYPGVQLTAWAMIVGPAGMPQPVVDKMAKAFNEALKDPAVVKYHDDQGVTLMPDMQGARLREFVIKEQAKFKELVERSGATVQ